MPLVGNFAGPKALRAVGGYLKAHGATVTRVLCCRTSSSTCSRTELAPTFARNVGRAAARRRRARSSGRASTTARRTAAYRSVTMLDSMQGLLRDFDGRPRLVVLGCAAHTAAVQPRDGPSPHGGACARRPGGRPAGVLAGCARRRDPGAVANAAGAALRQGVLVADRGRSPSPTGLSVRQPGVERAARSSMSCRRCAR